MYKGKEEKNMRFNDQEKLQYILNMENEKVGVIKVICSFVKIKTCKT